MSLLQSIASTAASKAGAALVGTAFAVASVGAASATGLLPQLTAAEGDEALEASTETETGTDAPADTGTGTETETGTDAPADTGTETETDAPDDTVDGDTDVVAEPIEAPLEEPVVEDEAPNPVSQVVGVHQGDPGFGQAVAERARGGGLGQAVSEIARNKHRDADAEEGDGEEAGELDETDAGVEATGATTRKGGKPDHAKGRGGR